MLKIWNVYMYINIRIIGDWFSMDPILSAKLKTYRQNNCCIDMFGSIFSLTVNLDFSHFQEQVQILNSINPIYSLKLFFFWQLSSEILKIKVFIVSQRTQTFEMFAVQLSLLWKV